MIDNTGIAGYSARVVIPGLFEVLWRRFVEVARDTEILAKGQNLGTVGPSGSLVPAFQKGVRGGDQPRLPGVQGLERGCGDGMPLIGSIPQGHQTDGIQKHRSHG